MLIVRFHYKKLGPDTLRPIIPVQLEHSGRIFSYEVLIDSGADCCVFDSEIADALGIDITSGVRGEIAGLTGRPETFSLHDLVLCVGRHHHRARIGFLKHIGHYGHGIVGQRGFFDHYTVTFDFRAETIDLRPKRLPAGSS